MKTALALGLCIVAAAAFAVCAGNIWATPLDVLRAMAGDESLRGRLLFEWRIPRVLAAGLVGALLGLGGGVFQGVFRNPLAEPYLLGSAGGASIGAAVALLVPLGIPSFVALAGLSFVGAWAATWSVIAVARLAGTIDAVGLLLAGVAVSAVLGAVRSFLMLALSDETVNLQVVLSWTLGGIQTPSWQGLAVLALLSALGLVATLKLATGLDLLGLGEEQARAFGLPVDRFLNIAVVVAALVVAIAVAWGGLVAFVGLIGPHLARWLVGPRHRVLLPASAAIGAAIVLVCDGLARSLLPPAEVPLGMITAIVGGPFFLILLGRRLRA
ncbi:MAG: iron ABC transporter permease [Vicinamibacterales bacterium]